MNTLIDILIFVGWIIGWGAFFYYVMWLATDGNVMGNRSYDDGPLYGPNWRPGGFCRIYSPPPWIR